MTLVELLGLHTPIITFDLETTGPDPYKDRIVEVGFKIEDPRHEAKEAVREWSSFVNPGIPIPHEATYGNPEKGFDGHGITDDMVANAQPFSFWAPHLLRGFKGCYYAGYALKRFDLPLLQAEFQRAGHTWSFSEACILDGHRLWQIALGRTLADAVETFLGRKHEGAHRVIEDVRASHDVIVALLEKFPHLPRHIQQLHDLQWPRSVDALDPDNKIIWKDGVATMNFGKKWKGMRLDLMARKDLDWIASPACSGANDTVKQICRDAANGKFPERKA